MKTLTKLVLTFGLLSWIVTNSNAQHQHKEPEEPIKIGKVEKLLAPLTSKKSAKNEKPSFSLKTSEQTTYTTEVHYKSIKKNGYFVAGSLKNKENTSFFLSAEGNALRGHLIDFDKRLAYKYYSDEEGNVYSQEVDIHSLLCVDYDAAPDSAFAESVTSDKVTLKAAYDLQSLPGAAGCVMLDFDGQYVSGTLWNNGNPINAASANMTDAQIQEFWELVSEDYRPFNVNITTSESVFNTYPRNRRMRCIVTPTNTAAPGAGGVAYVGSFAWNDDTPCWVFMTNPKVGGDAAAHEIGHTFGLGHDGRTNPAEEYFLGHEEWAPIMGAAYYVNVGQWSKGEYAYANNFQDDMAIIASSTYGVGYRSDDHSNNISGATPLIIESNGNVPSSNSGVITTAGDWDYFSFATAGGNISLHVNTVSRHGDLDIVARLYDSNGAQIGQWDPSGLNATVTASLDAGTYYLAVDGIGMGNPETDGYTDYASVGSYWITGTIPAATVPQSPYADAISIPGIVEMENYDNGGEGVAYHDADASNKSGAYRSNGVDIEACTEGGFNIDYSVSGEWLEYTVNVASTANYTMNVRVASPIGGSFHVEMDGSDISGVQTVPNTGGWQTWKTVSTNVNLTTGKHIMRFFIDQQEFNTNNITFSINEPSGEDITDLGGTISAQYDDSPSAERFPNLTDNNTNTKYLTFHASTWIQYKATGNFIVTGYSITSANDAAERDPLSWTLQGSTDGSSWTTIDSRSGIDFPNRLQTLNFEFTNSSAYQYYRFNLNNNSGSILQLAEVEIFGIAAETMDVIEAETMTYNSGVITETCDEGGENVGSIDTGDWMSYAGIEIPYSGTYTVSYRVASESTGGQLSLDHSSGATILHYVDIPVTGGWQTWTTVSKTMTLEAGVYDFGIYAQAGGWNINWFSISYLGAESPKKATTLAEDKKCDITIFPNPATDWLHISGVDDDTQLEIYTTTGKLIKTSQGNAINVESLQHGIYLIQIKSDNSTTIGKFIKR